MMLRKMQAAGGSPSFVPSPLFSRDHVRNYAVHDRAVRDRAKSREASRREASHGGALWYGGVTLGLLASAAVSVYLWKQRERALNLLQTTPFERAEELISSCEHKIEDIERAIEELKQAAR